MLLLDLDSGDAGDDIGELVNGHHPVLAEVKGFMKIRTHQPVEAFHTVFDITKGAGLLAVAPDVDGVFPGKLGISDLAAKGGRGFFAPAFPGAFFAKDVMEPDGPRLQPVIITIMVAKDLADELLTAIGVLRLRRIAGRFFL